MSMRLKLIFSYLVMGFIPIILLIAVTIGAIYSVVSISPFLKSLDQSEEKIIQGIDQLLNLELLSRDNPEGLYDKKMLAGADEKLSPFHVGIILLDSDQKVFYASRFLDQQVLLPKIHAAAQEQNRAADQKKPLPDRMMNHEYVSHLGYQRPFMVSNFSVFSKPLDKYGLRTLYLVVETGPEKQMNNTSFRRFVGFVFCGMVGIILLMTFLVTRSMMQSLSKLKEGVHHISKGDLNFSIKTSKRDEVAQVVMAFEEMRLRLKASIDAQMKEDENRKELVANISHDLKTPVTAIKGYIEGLIDGVADTPEKKEKYLKTVLGKTIALDRMIDDLFLYSSLDIGRTNYHFETIPAAEFFENLCSETKLDLTERGFVVDCSLQIPSDVRVRVDRQMIHRLQHNLTENASKYSRSSGRKVDFTAFIQGNEVVCSTEDNGIGIQASEMPHIFERFYRADAARTSTVGGTGLGLQITKKIIEDHDGRIWAESNYGEFTRISWTLPIILPDKGVSSHVTGNNPTECKESGGEPHA